MKNKILLLLIAIILIEPSCKKSHSNNYTCSCRPDASVSIWVAGNIDFIEPSRERAQVVCDSELYILRNSKYNYSCQVY